MQMANDESKMITKTMKSSFLISDILEEKEGNITGPCNFALRYSVSPALSLISNDDSDACFSPVDDSAEGNNYTRSKLGHHGAGSLSLSKKSRKARTIFSDKQLQALEDCFEKQKYLSVQDRMDLAKRLNLSDTQVKTWYQNRRTKWKRQTAVGCELLTEANNIVAVQQLLMGGYPYWSQFFKSYVQNNQIAAAAASSPMFRLYPPSAENQFPTVTLPTSSSSGGQSFPSVLCR